jgi:hypothetical protein
MMRLAQRATLLVALSLLTSAATTYAECAWVLWGIADGKFYAPVASFTAKPECDSEMQRLRREQQSAVWVCLPDTGDPHGPKGK